MRTAVEKVPGRATLEPIAVRAAVAVIALLALPFFLRKRWRVVRRIFIASPPSDIFPLVNDLRNWAAWTEWSRRDEMRMEYSGPPAGAGSTLVWSGRRSSGETRIIQSVENEQVLFNVSMNEGRFALESLIAFDSLGAGTRVTWLCRWESGPNPYTRYLDLLVRYRFGRDLDRELLNLKRLSERGAMDAKLKTDDGG